MLHLVDHNPEVAHALQKSFTLFPEVTVEEGDLLAVAVNAVVSPANGYGFMDGGIDTAYARFFGHSIETRVRDAIAKRPEGFLPVGASIVVLTGNSRIPYLIVAATMLMPEMVSASNCYRAMRAVLRVVATDSKVANALYCPGLGTGVGSVGADDAAREMARAYGDWQSARVAKI